MEVCLAIYKRTILNLSRFYFIIILSFIEDRLADRSPSPSREDTDRTDDSGMHDPGSGGSENENDPEVNALIESSDMEGLASLVLNGQGWRLLNMRSRDTELQTFLSNVPQYMVF